MTSNINNANDQEEVINKVLTIPNVISGIRLCLVVVFVILILEGHNIGSTVCFAVAALTDFLDGYIARATHTISKLGQILDPAVDRILMLTGVVSLAIVGRIPLWIFVLVFVRDVSFIIGYSLLLKKFHVRVPVIYLGKVATTFFFVGFAVLLLNIPITEGLGIVSVSWLPGFNSDPYCWGIWLIYIGVILGFITTCYYIDKSFKMCQAVQFVSEHLSINSEESTDNTDNIDNIDNTENTEYTSAIPDSDSKSQLQEVSESIVNNFDGDSHYDTEKTNG